MSRYVGKLDTSSPRLIAERAIGAAEDLSRNSTARFAAYIDDHRRINVVKVSARRAMKQEGWIATFTKASDVAWLEEQIADAAA